MRASVVFLTGLLIGGAGGALLTWRVVGDTQPETAANRGATAAAIDEARQDVPTLITRAAVEASGEGQPGAVAPTPSASPPASAPPANPSPVDPYRAKLDEVRAQLRLVRTSEAGAPDVLALLTSLRELIGHADPQIARLGSRALIALAGEGKLTPALVEGMAKEFPTLQAGAPARAALAGAVARAWARDDRLAGWFDGLPQVEEPAVRAVVVEALDESASVAYREYLLRLSQTEPDPDVLEHVWHEDPITVAMTREWAPRLIAAIEPRLERGGLPPVVRGRGLFAIGLAAVHEPAAAAAAIGRLIDLDVDAGVRDYGQAVLGAIEREEANVQTLDRLWAEHHRHFGAK